MKVCIFGAGAVGGHLATRLLNANADEISLVARGVMLKAIRERGLTLRSNGKEEIHVKPKIVTDDPSTLPPQDLVLVTVKAHALSAAAPAIGKLLAPGGTAIFLLNGIPWWFQHGRKGAKGTLPLLDPDGALWREVKPERTLGCVVLSPNDMVEPGVIVHTGGNHLMIGEPDNSTTPRLEAAIAMFKRGGIDARIATDLRRDIWQKLCLNASGNTVTALSRNDLAQVGTDDGLRMLMVNIMKETLAVAAAQGWDLRPETDVEAATRRGRPGQRPSMMQDALAGRAMECEALVGQTQAFARDLGVATPTIDIILPLIRGLDRSFRVK
jgi:2-dehydropantoate 2-reductase